jgi:hypothetical protein
VGPCNRQAAEGASRAGHERMRGIKRGPPAPHALLVPPPLPWVSSPVDDLPADVPAEGGLHPRERAWPRTGPSFSYRPLFFSKGK